MKKTLVLSLVLMLAASAVYARGRRGKPAPDLSGKNVQELLVMLTSDEKEAMRTYAAYALMERKDASTLAPMLALMTDASAPERVRSAVAYGIHKFEDKSAVPALLTLLEQPKFRFEAMKSLGELKAKDAVEPIIDIILHHIMHEDDGGDDFVDHNADMVSGAEALGKIGEPAGLRGVLPMMFQETAYRRKVAVEAIDAIGMKEGNPEILKTELLLPVMTSLLTSGGEYYDKSSDVRLEAVFSLSHLKDQSTAELLRATCESDEDARVRYASRDALKGMNAGTCDAYKPIRKYLPKEMQDAGR